MTQSQKNKMIPHHAKKIQSSCWSLALPASHSVRTYFSSLKVWIPPFFIFVRSSSFGVGLLSALILTCCCSYSLVKLFVLKTPNYRKPVFPLPLEENTTETNKDNQRIHYFFFRYHKIHLVTTAPVCIIICAHIKWIRQCRGKQCFLQTLNV